MSNGFGYLKTENKESKGCILKRNYGLSPCRLVAPQPPTPSAHTPNCVIQQGLINLPNAAAIWLWQWCFLPTSPHFNAPAACLPCTVICQCRAGCRGAGADYHWSGVLGLEPGLLARQQWMHEMWLLLLDCLSLCSLFDGFDHVPRPTPTPPHPHSDTSQSRRQLTWFALSNWCCHCCPLACIVSQFRLAGH